MCTSPIALPSWAGRRRGTVGAIALRRGLSAAIAALALTTRGAAQAEIPVRADYATAARTLEQFIAQEREAKGIPAVSIALVDGREIVWAQGFGLARPRDGVPASAATVYRVGAVSTLLTTIAVLQLVEQGRVALDSPVTHYLPDFAPRNPFAQPVTLRQLLSHRAGLVREPPLGSYFDSAPPSLAATVASLNATALVYQPGARYKYSNAALTVAGRVVEAITGEPFATAARRMVLGPAGMRASAFRPPDGGDTTVAAGLMWAPDGRQFVAPTFALGISPASGLYAPVTDLARLLATLFVDGRPGSGERVLRPESVAAISAPQFTDRTAAGGEGLGVSVTRWQGQRRIDQTGTVYGHVSQLAALPDLQLGVIVSLTRDDATAVAGRIADLALRAMLAVRAGAPMPEPVATLPVPPALAGRVAGSYGRGERGFELRDRAAGLLWAPGTAGLPRRVGARGDTLVVDDPTAFGPRLLPLAGGHPRVVVHGDTVAPTQRARPSPPPARWSDLLGEYGWNHQLLFVQEGGGRLHSVIEWFYSYPMEEVAPDTLVFPDSGRYQDERLTFTRGPDGRVVAAQLGGISFPRRMIGPRDGQQLRVTPVAPVAQVLAAARRASPPVDPDGRRAPDLVELVTLDSTIRLDIRYATTENFLGAAFYPTPRALLQRPAALALVRAHRWLRARGYGLLVHDGYRPWYVTRAFWDATPPPLRWMVADPSAGSRHNRGCAVDVTLFDLTAGAAVDMGGTYDETTPRSYPDYPVATSLQRWHRELLREALVREGFRPIVDEWWHFDYYDWRTYPIMNLSLDDVEDAR